MDNKTLSVLMNVREVANLLRVAPLTVYGLIWSGKLSHVRIGRAVRVRRSDLDTFIAENTVAIRPAA